jgi:hypothetical protein
LFGRAAKNFGKATQIDCICSAAQRKFTIGEQKQLKLARFVQLRSEIFWNWRTKATLIDCICSAAQRKTLELANKSNLNRQYVLSRAAKNFGIGENKNNSN